MAQTSLGIVLFLSNVTLLGGWLPLLGRFSSRAWLSSSVRAPCPLSPESLVCRLNAGQLQGVQEEEDWGSTWGGDTGPEVSLFHQSWPRPRLHCLCFLGLSKGRTGRLERRSRVKGSRQEALNTFNEELSSSSSSSGLISKLRVCSLLMSLCFDINSPKPTGCPPIHFSSDTNYPELCRPHRLRAQLTRLSPLLMPAASPGSPQATHTSI